MMVDHDAALDDWIQKRIVEISDGEVEPAAFSKYVLALLKKDSNEEMLKNICVEQLKVFLGSNTEEFVSSLFVALKNRSYLPSDNGDSIKGSPEISMDSQDSKIQHKKIEISQRRRISPPARDDTRSKGRQRHSRSSSRSLSPHSHRQKRGRRNQSRSPQRHRPIMLDEKNFDLEPTANSSSGISFNRSLATNTLQGSGFYGITKNLPSFDVPLSSIVKRIPMNQMRMMPYTHRKRMYKFGPMSGFGRSQGYNHFGHYKPARFLPKVPSIEVRRIPSEINKIGLIHGHFEQYGEITNIQISFDGSPDTALITYAKMDDAQSAMKSTKPILDNRFIRTSWYKPPPSSESKAEKGVSFVDVKTEPSDSQLTQAQEEQSTRYLAEEKARRKKRKLTAHLKEIHVLKSQLYEEEAAVLKEIYERLLKSTDSKIKGQLMELSKKLDESLKELGKEIRETYEQIQKGEKSKDYDDEFEQCMEQANGQDWEQDVDYHWSKYTDPHSEKKMEIYLEA